MKWTPINDSAVRAMIDLAQDATVDAPASRRRSRRRIWISVGVAVLLVAAGAITAIAVSLHYLHAAPLVTDGGGWLPPDSRHARSVSVGPYTALIVPPRPGHAQTFQMDLINESSVSQTVLGLTDGRTLANPQLTGEPEHLSISTASVFPSHGRVNYTSAPVTIPPHGQYSLRFTLDTGHIWQPCRSEYWQGLSLRVRVGVFTRTEYLDFNSLILELHDPRRRC